MRRVLALAIGLAALVLGIGAAHAQSITVGSLTLRSCQHLYGGYCGTLARPLDPSGAVPGKIDIGFEFYPHTDTADPGQGAVIAQEGGPGYSTTGSRDGYVRLFTPLRDHRDIVVIDKRGTGRSGAIDCRPLQHAAGGSLGAVRACGAQLGRSAWLYGTELAADDVAAVLAALQTGPVDYYGDSYGTFFGQVFATRHPDLLRTIVLDSAYPVITHNGSPYFPTELENGAPSLERVCARSAACRDHTPSITERFAALLTALRAQKVSGQAPGANGEMRSVTADPAGLFLVFYEVGNNLIAYRDLDAAGRAYLDHGDALPLLRLVAEATDASAGFSPANQFSNGEATAVMCQDYHTLFDMRAGQADRGREFARAIANKAANDPSVYAPFLLSDALAAPTNPEALDTCLAWPAAPPDATPGVPVPPTASFPKIPVLVLAGELDTVTSPREAAQTTALFPEAWFVVLRNMGHETAIGDGGVFVPPNGADLAGCAGAIVLNFVGSGGNPGDTSCALHVRPIRTVPDFALSWSAVAPAQPEPGNVADATRLALASAAVETLGDAVARYYVTTSGVDLGLRGGRFHLSPDIHGYQLHLAKLRWTQDLAVSGIAIWDQLDGHIRAELTLAAPGHAGHLTVEWNDREPDARTRIRGVVDGQVVDASRLAP
jgi:pimeloyl-ACP methyl ester carboxylesterase